MAVCPIITPASQVLASFHLVQIEQVIGGVDGDTSVQAIQLRIRFPGDNQFQFARLRAWDEAGQNPVTIIAFDSPTPNGGFGDRVLITSENFAAHLDSALAADFTMTNLIPVSYLTAGRLTFESVDGTIFWSLSYGGVAYTGPTTGTGWNDDDEDFGPPFDGPLPTSHARGLLFQGEASDISTTNFDDYAVTRGPAFFINNAGESARVAGCAGPIDLGAGTDLRDFAIVQDCLSNAPGSLAECCDTADLNNDLTIDLVDYGLLFDELAGP